MTSVLNASIHGTSHLPAVADTWAVGFTSSSYDMDTGARVQVILPQGFDISSITSVTLGGFSAGTTIDPPAITGQQVSITIRGEGVLLPLGQPATVSFSGVVNPVARVYLREGFRIRTTRDADWVTMPCDVPVGVYGKAAMLLLEADI